MAVSNGVLTFGSPGVRTAHKHYRCVRCRETIYPGQEIEEAGGPEDPVWLRHAGGQCPESRPTGGWSE